MGGCAHAHSSPPRRRPVALAAVVALNGAAIVVLWIRAGGFTDVHGLGSALTSAGRIAGLLGAYLVLVELLLLGADPAARARRLGFERLARLAPVNGRACITLLLAHARADHRRLHDRRPHLAAGRGRAAVLAATPA